MRREQMIMHSNLRWKIQSFQPVYKEALGRILYYEVISVTLSNYWDSLGEFSNTAYGVSSNKTTSGRIENGVKCLQCF